MQAIINKIFISSRQFEAIKLVRIMYSEEKTMINTIGMSYRYEVSEGYNNKIFSSFDSVRI